MTKAFINERKFDSPVQDKNLLPIHGNKIRVQTVTFTTTTQSAAIGAGSDYIDFTVDGPAHYEIGSNPTATTSSPYIGEGERIAEQVAEGQKIAFIDAA